jgi:hypothetical protein
VTIDRARYLRQILLAGVGEQGQQRLAAARVSIPSETAEATRSVARRYLERAGLGAVTVESGPAEAPAWLDEAVSDPAARAVIEGSLLALDRIKLALG